MVQLLMTVKLVLSLDPFGIVKFCIHIDIDKLEPKALPDVIFHTIWPRQCRSQNSTKKKKKKKNGKWPYLLNRSNSLIKFCLHVDIDKI